LPPPRDPTRSDLPAQDFERHVIDDMERRQMHASAFWFPRGTAPKRSLCGAGASSHNATKTAAELTFEMSI
jgi:hypothetical protein